MLSNLGCYSTESEPLKNGCLKHQTISQFKCLFTPRRFLLSHWCRSDRAGSCILHRLPCSSTLLCKQVLCCCRSSFASRQTSCTCTSSARVGFPVPVLLWSAMVQEALRPSPIHDPLVIQNLASLQEHVSTQMLGSLTASDVEVDNQTSVEAFRFSASSGRTWGSAAHLRCLSSWMLYIGCKHRLRACQQWLRSALVPLREETDYLDGQYYGRNYPTPFSSQYPPKNWSNHSLWLYGIQGENCTSFHPKHGRWHTLERNVVDPSHRCETTILGSPNFWSG